MVEVQILHKILLKIKATLVMFLKLVIVLSNVLNI